MIVAPILKMMLLTAISIIGDRCKASWIKMTKDV